LADETNDEVLGLAPVSDDGLISVIFGGSATAGGMVDDDVTEDDDDDDTVDVTDVVTEDDKEADPTRGEDPEAVLSLFFSGSGSAVSLSLDCDDVGAGTVMLCLATTELYCCISITAASSNT